MRRSTVALLFVALSLPAQIYRQNDPGVKPPVPIRKVEPGYSEDARKGKVSGRAHILMIVNEQGLPEKIHVVRFEDLHSKEADDHGLSGKAHDAVAQWRFKPAQKDGKPVAVWVRMEVNFRVN